MASPLLRYLFGQNHSLRDRQQTSTHQHSKDPQSDLDSTAASVPRKLRLRSNRTMLASDEDKEKASSASFVTSESTQDPVKDGPYLQDKFKPLPPPPARVDAARTKKRGRKRKLPRAMSKRSTPQPKSKLRLTAVPSEDAVDSPMPDIPWVRTSPCLYDELPADSQSFELKQEGSPHHSKSYDAESHTELKHSDLLAKPENSQRGLSHLVNRDGLLRSPDDEASSSNRLVRGYKQPISKRASAARQEIPRSKYDDINNNNQVIATTEIDSQVSCYHPLGFRHTQRASWNCKDTQWDDGLTMLTSSVQSSSLQQALRANNDPLSREHRFGISPPPSFHRSTARTSHLGRSRTNASLISSDTTSTLDLTELISPTSPPDISSSETSAPRTPSISSISLGSPSLTTSDATLGVSSLSQAHKRQLERSPSKAMLGPSLSPTAAARSAHLRTTTPSPSPPTSCPAILVSPPKIQPLIGLPAPLVLSQASGPQTSARYLNPRFEEAVFSGQENVVSSDQDFFITYFDAMERGTEHSWAVALRNSDLSDKAIADAYLSDLPDEMLAHCLEQKPSFGTSNDIDTIQMAGPRTAESTVYTFGTKMDTSSSPNQSSRPSSKDNTSPSKRTVLQGRDLRELELLSPIREERESQNSLLAPTSAAIVATPASTPQSSASQAKIPTPAQASAIENKTHETTQCDPCRNNRARLAKHRRPPKCDKLLPSCTQCISSNTPCSYRGSPVATSLSMAHRQRLLVHILATAGGIAQPAQQICQRFRPRDTPADADNLSLSLGQALDAVIHTIRSVRELTAVEIVDGDGVPMSPDSLAEYHGALALVLAAVWALERATAEAEEEGGVMLVLKTSSNAAHVEFVNRVFEVLAAFGARGAEHGGGVTLRVLDACVAQVDDALWRLWEQMEGGLDENGQAMGKEIHWDVMVEVSREVIGRGFVDASQLAEVRQALEKVAGFKWMP